MVCISLGLWTKLIKNFLSPNGEHLTFYKKKKKDTHNLSFTQDRGNSPNMNIKICSLTCKLKEGSLSATRSVAKKLNTVPRHAFPYRIAVRAEYNLSFFVLTNPVMGQHPMVLTDRTLKSNSFDSCFFVGASLLAWKKNQINQINRKEENRKRKFHVY